MTNKLSHSVVAEIKTDIETIERILRSRVIETRNNRWTFEDSSTRLFICLRDLLAKSSKYAGKHVDFSDDVIKSPIEARKKVRNVSDLVEYMRNAAAHPDAENHQMTQGISMSFGRVFGKIGGYFMVPGKVFDPPCDYEDDVAIVFGYQRIYLNRHITKAFEEAKGNLEPVITNFQKEERERFVAKQVK